MLRNEIHLASFPFGGSFRYLSSAFRCPLFPVPYPLSPPTHSLRNIP